MILKTLKLSIISLLVISTFNGCTDKENAERILSQDGYTDIQITGYTFFACSSDDFQRTGFIAKKGNKLIEGSVCSGLLFKNSTIRFK